MAIKTNAMRILDKAGIQYELKEYDISDGLIDGEHVAVKCNQEYKNVYKTLVSVGNDRNYYVFVIPVNKTLNLKVCAKVLNIKSVELISVSELLKITGYVRGGCSPIGMKKNFPTIFDEDINHTEFIWVSGGKLGLQICLRNEDLIKITKGKAAKIT